MYEPHELAQLARWDTSRGLVHSKRWNGAYEKSVTPQGLSKVIPRIRVRKETNFLCAWCVKQNSKLNCLLLACKNERNECFNQVRLGRRPKAKADAAAQSLWSHGFSWLRTTTDTKHRRALVQHVRIVRTLACPRMSRKWHQSCFDIQRASLVKYDCECPEKSIQIHVNPAR